MRARNIRAEFWKSEDVGELSFSGRLLFIGLWGLADRRGVLPLKVKRIKAEVFPYDDVKSDDVEALLRQMGSLGMVVGYGVPTGDQWLQVCNFAKHQAMSGRERKDGLLYGPLPTDEGMELLFGRVEDAKKWGLCMNVEESGHTRDMHGTDSGHTQVAIYLKSYKEIYKESFEPNIVEVAPAPSTCGEVDDDGLDLDLDDSESAAGADSDGGDGDEGAGEGETGVNAGGRTGTGVRTGAIRFVDGAFVGVTAKDVERWGKQAPGVDVEREVLRAAGWLGENPKRMKKNLRAFLGNWVRRAGDRVPATTAAAVVASTCGAQRPKAWAGYGSKG